MRDVVSKAVPNPQAQRDMEIAVKANRAAGLYDQPPVEEKKFPWLLIGAIAVIIVVAAIIIF